MISAVSDCMAMSRSFWNRKVVLLLTQLVPGLVHGSAVCRTGTNQAAAHGKGAAKALVILRAKALAKDDPKALREAEEHA